MSVYLPAPQHKPTGVDGCGWNRIAIHGGMCMDECALKPKTIASFFDALDTRKARYGTYGTCLANGDCDSCSTLTAENPWRWFGDSMFVRVANDNIPWIMNRQIGGWEVYGVPTTWDYLLTLNGVEFKRQRDEHSDGLMMIRVES